MHAVATRAISHGLRAAFGGQAVEGRVEAHQPVARHAEFSGQAHISVAASAGVPYVAAIYRTGGVGVFEDLVLAMAIGAQRRLTHAACQRLAVHAGAELIHHLGVAHAAGVGDCCAEGLGFRGEQFVGAAVAQGAIGRPVVSTPARLAVGTLIVIACLVGMARNTGWFGDIRGVRDLFVRFVAGIAGERCVRALGQLLTLLVAGGAFGSGVAGGVKVRAGGAGKQA